MTVEDAAVLEAIADAMHYGELDGSLYRLAPEDAARVGVAVVHVPSVLKLMADAIRAEAAVSTPGVPLQ